MAGGFYTLDPATGQPMMQTASGAFVPLPLSEEEMQQAGAQLAPPPGVAAVAPPQGPDMRVAGPGGGAGDLGGADPAMAQFIADQNQAGQVAAMRQQLAPQAPPTNTHPTQDRFQQLEQLGQPRPGRQVAGVDPATLARGGGRGAGAPQQEQPGGGGIDDPLVQQAMAEAMRGGGGGGGPRKLGVSGETHKYKGFQAPMDPRLAQQAGEAQLASEGYNEQLAMSLQQRQQQAYEATQAEFASRSGQLAAVQQRYEQQQAMLQDYTSKRDALIEEARQMKAPDQRTYWQEAGVMGKLTAGLSMVFGGALAGLRGGQNMGLEATRMAVDDWMRVRKDEYDRAQDSAQAADTKLGKMVQQFGSENLALEHMRLQAWEVRDSMLRSYAEKIGTPDALEIYNQAMLQSEAEKAAVAARASQGAEVEIEQKLAMQGGGGGARPGVLNMLRAGAEATKLRNTIEGKTDAPAFTREVQNEKVDGITGALEAIEAADEVQHTLRQLDKADDDFDNPLSGPLDFAARLPGTDARRQRQALEQQTALLARGLQQSLGKSDNDARLADEMAEGGGSGRQRFTAAQTGKQRAQGKLQNIVASLTPAQQETLLRSLESNSPARAAQVRAAIAATSNPQAAPSEQLVR